MHDRVLYSLLGCEIPPPCPLGPPPDASDLIDDVEHLIKEPEFKNRLGTPREIDIDQLLTDFKPFPPYRKLRPKRDFSSGHIVAFEEVSKDESGPLSLTRPFDKKTSVTGNAAIGVPFWVGFLNISLSSRYLFI